MCSCSNLSNASEKEEPINVVSIQTWSLTDSWILELSLSNPDEYFIEFIPTECLLRVVIVLHLLQDHIGCNEDPVYVRHSNILVEDVALLTVVGEVYPTYAGVGTVADLCHEDFLDLDYVVFDDLLTSLSLKII